MLHLVRVGQWMGHRNLKSFWRERNGALWSFICPLCRVERRLPLGPRPGTLKHFFQIGLLTVVFAILCWSKLSGRGFIAFIPFWSIFEVLYRWKLRILLPCSQCGFDPYLFSSDVKRAQQEVEHHWRKKFADKGIPYPHDPKVGLNVPVPVLKPGVSTPELLG